VSQSLSILKSKLNANILPKVPISDGVVSSVLVPLAIDLISGKEWIVMTKRPETVATHKGQVCFPGGYREVLDPHVLDTALREANEEMGIQSGDVDVLGLMDVVRTHQGVLIYPFLGIIPFPYPFQTSPHEVAKLVMLPLDQLVSEGLKSVQVEAEGSLVSSTGIWCDGELIWGASAKILEQLHTLLVLAD